MCVCEIGRCAAFFLLSFSVEEEENSKGGGGAGGVLLISSADDAHSVVFFWKFEKVLFFSPYMWQNGTLVDDVDISGLEIFQLFC